MGELRAYAVESPSLKTAFLIMDDGEQQEIISGSIAIIEAMAHELGDSVSRWRYLEGEPSGFNKMRLDRAEGPRLERGDALGMFEKYVGKSFTDLTIVVSNAGT